MAQNQENPDVFYIESKRATHKKHKTEDDLYLDSYTGHNWGERLSFTVGVSYIVAAGFGGVKGFIEGMPKKYSLPKKLLLNNFFNSVGKETCRFGNAAAGAGLLYYMSGSTLNFLFEDELAFLSNNNKNVLCGALTGFLYKSTLGIIPACVGSILGGAMMGSLTQIIQYLNQKEYIAFEMRF